MPHFWNNKVVVTKDELIPDFFASWDALRRKLDREAKKPYGIRRARMGKGLGNEVLIDYDTLPLEICKELKDPRKVDCILERYFWEDAKAVEYFANVKAGKRGYLDPERQKEYVLDASVILAAIRLRHAHISECTVKGLSVKNTDRYISESVNTFNHFRAIKNLPEHTLPTNPVSLKRKIERFEKEGYSSLLSRYDNNNAARKTERIMALLNAMFAQDEKPTMAEVYRKYEGFLSGYVEVINATTGEVYDPKDYGKLSERTVTAFLSSWKEKIATNMKRMSDRQKYMAQFNPTQSFEPVKYAGSIISIDDRQPPFEYEKGKRMWFYNGIDLGSECIVAFVWGKDKEGLILDFYRELTRNYAEWGVKIPYEIECESSLNSSYKETLLKPGNMFQEVHIIPNMAHAKKIERHFGMLRYDYEKKRSGWIGRPFAKREANQTNPEKKIIIPYDQLVRNCLEDIVEWNNSPHSEHKDKTRWEVFMEKQHPELTPTNWRGILPYIGERTHTSCNQGQIKLNNGLCLLGDDGVISTGEELINLMDMVEGREFDVYWLRGHNGQTLKAFIYLDNRCICEAIPKPRAIRSKLEAKGNEQAAINFTLVEKYKSTVMGYARRHKNEIEKVIVIDNRKRTLNNGFKLPWLDTINKPMPMAEPEETEALPGLDEDIDFMPVSTGYKLQALEQRF
jgi:hypothetical protein